MLLRAAAVLLAAAGIASAAGADLDPTFSGDGWLRTPQAGSGDDFVLATNPVEDLALQRDGKLLSTGEMQGGSSEWIFGVFRHLPDGSLDPSFAGKGWAKLDLPGSFEEAQAVAVQADGKIVLGGRSQCGVRGCFTLVRLTPDGSLDRSFGGDGVARAPVGGLTDLAIQRDGRIVAVGARAASSHPQNMSVFQVVRYLTDGRLDRSFSRDGIASVDFGWGNQVADAVALQRDGKILVAGRGSRNAAATGDEFVLARLRPNGRLDRSFSGDGKVAVDFGRTWHDHAHGIALLRDGRVALVGASRTADATPPPRLAVALLRSNGRLVWRRLLRPSRYGGYANDVVQAHDGSLLVGGRVFNRANGVSSDWLLARYRLDGRLMLSFGRGGLMTTKFGTEDSIEALALQPDGKLVAAGAVYGSHGLARYRLR